MPPARYLRREDEASLINGDGWMSGVRVSSSAASCRTAVAVAGDREAVFAGVCARFSTLPWLRHFKDWMYPVGPSGAENGAVAPPQRNGYLCHAMFHVLGAGKLKTGSTDALGGCGRQL